MKGEGTRTVLVTGANRGIGLGAARALAGRGHRVLMACRDRAGAEAARNSIAEDAAVKAAGGILEIEALDLGSLRSVRALAASLIARGRRLDALVNNAGVFRSERGLTEDGFERCLGVNFLGPFLLTRLLLPLLEGGGRIVNTTSIAGLIGRLDPRKLEAEAPIGPFRAYARSKLAVILMSLELSRRLKGRATVNAVHPGVVNTSILTMRRWYDPLTDALFRPFTLGVDEGARPSVELAVSPEAEGLTGLYFSGMKARALPGRIRDPARGVALWEKASILVGLDRE
jgi:retinol dehydrogenase 12